MNNGEGILRAKGEFASLTRLIRNLNYSFIMPAGKTVVMADRVAAASVRIWHTADTSHKAFKSRLIQSSSFCLTAFPSL